MNTPLITEEYRNSWKGVWMTGGIGRQGIHRGI